MTSDCQDMLLCTVAVALLQHGQQVDAQMTDMQNATMQCFLLSDHSLGIISSARSFTHAITQSLHKGS